MVARRAHQRRGGPVKGYHNKFGTWVPPTHRGDSDISESRELTQRRAAERLRRLTGFTSPLIFLTHCWWCGERVHFYRSDVGGCALFDMPGYPWPIHRCWKNYREQTLSRIASQLAEYRFNGRTYSQERMRLTKPQGQDSLTVTGFVDRAPSTSNRTFCSCRNAIAGTFREIRFVPETDASVFYALNVPVNVADNFPFYSYHTLDAVWMKHGGRWALFLHNFRRLRANGRADKIIRGTIANETDCFYCGCNLAETPWGFDTNFRPECRDCGSCRRAMSGDGYVAYIKTCYNRINKVK